ncbi:MAG: hypothetical protein GX575_12955 [Candidatus Anammoximicrobium sp.]|nr:hypothetical protein [Candidatus Anammoximicrobium sp.]
MTQIIRLQDLSAAEVSRLLAASRRRLTGDQGDAAEKCAGEIARIKRACDTLRTLRALEEAA